MGNLNNEHIPVDEARVLVSALAACGVPHAGICFCLARFVRTTSDPEGVKISEKTLRKHYKEELKAKQEYAKSLVVGSLFNKIMRGDTRAMIFYLKTQCGWRETINLDLNNPIPSFDLLGTDPTGEIIEAEFANVPERPILG